MSEGYGFNKVEMAYTGIADAFPEVPLETIPLGSRVLVQLRSAKRKTKGGIILTGDTRETEQWNTQIAIVRACGPLAFHDRKTMTVWPEGAWCVPGDFVRVPKYGGDRWSVTDAEGDEVLLVLFNDMDIVARIEGDPLAIKAFI